MHPLIVSAGGWAVRHWKGLAAAAAVAAVVGVGAHLVDQVRDARAERDAALLRVDSAEAAADTTREVLLAALGDHARWFERRAVQVRGDVRDSLSAELERVTRAHARLEVRFDSVAADVTAAAPAEELGDSLDTRTATWDVRRPPVRAIVQVWVPKPPADPRLRFTASVDPVPMSVRVGCNAAPAEGGIRPATVSVTTPPWAEVRVVGASQSADVCNPHLSVTAPSWWERHDEEVFGVGGVLLGVWAGKGFPLPKFPGG